MYPTPDGQAGDDRRMDTYTHTHTHINWEAGLAVCKKKKEKRKKKSSDDTTVLY